MLTVAKIYMTAQKVYFWVLAYERFSAYAEIFHWFSRNAIWKFYGQSKALPAFVSKFRRISVAVSDEAIFLLWKKKPQGPQHYFHNWWEWVVLSIAVYL